ncbi:arrestin domain-containing protein [Colletotrichum truncatum]|uniref:Arrestin domain-containing protein n=1 Tax=Colletotrichum truncatum TaxID=5467 RepID=A0ACC3ZJW6_COLTU|nr:arrestin domain-containing protein [Colletotrichum truncatum]KAF6799795.1 arrestin domain-containing protein [Colletotrichum truncatum]
MSSQSDMSSVVTFARQSAHRKQSIEININDHYTSKVYSSGSPISGDVIITPAHDCRFDYVQILLLGTSRTRLDAVQIPQLSSHTFLKLEMPIPESAYPVPRIFEAGRTYTIPFNFVIPHHLTISACTHKAQSDLIHDYHMRLPPSMGSWEKDDMTPDMAQIHYALKARVVRQDELGGRPTKVMEDAYLLNVLPASPEDPPLNITKQDKGYALSKTKTIRKNLFSSKQGRITASTVQPGAIYLTPDGRGASEGSLMVNLNFEPTSADVLPPKVSTVSAKIQAQTWYGATPMTRLPNMGDSHEVYALTQQLAYQTAVPLFSTTVDKTHWRQQVASITRRDSGYSSDGLREASHSDSDGTHHSRGRRSSKDRSSPVAHLAALQIPFKLPTSRKTFIPTFHACIISRTYTLQLTLVVGDTKINLAVPVQIAVEPPAQQDMGLPSFDAVMAQQEEAEADAHLQPRLMQQPAPELQGNAVLPGYNDLSTRRAAVPTA